MDTLTGPALVKAVSVSMPGSNISCVLDKTNDILNQRVLDAIKYDKYDTVFHLVKSIIKYDISEENTLKILKMVTQDASFSDDLKIEVLKFIDSGLLNSVSKFIEKKKCRFKLGLCCSSKR